MVAGQPRRHHPQRPSVDARSRSLTLQGDILYRAYQDETVAFDIGGFDVGSRLTYQVYGSVDYQWNDSFALHAGYRLLSIDYEDGPFLYDVRMHGPMIATTYKF